MALWRSSMRLEQSVLRYSGRLPSPLADDGGAVAEPGPACWRSPAGGWEEDGFS